MAKENSENQRGREEKSKTTSIWEWMIAAAGLILVAASIGIMIYRAATQETTPPRLEVVVDLIEPNGDGYLVKFIVKNTGNQTAAAVAVEGELKAASETAVATLTYVPSNSARRGGLFFTKNPQQFDLQIRVTGYEEP